MSAIAAIFHADGGPAGADRIAAMTAAMAYRGPDGIGHLQDESVALGECAFRTTKEDNRKGEPLKHRERGLTLVLDGYLTNRDPLENDLQGRGALLRDASDAELVIAAYAIWGDHCCERLEGEFAFAIHDARNQRIFLACDHAGLRQLHYHWDGECLIAATDIVGVLAALPERPAPNLPYLAEHVANEWYSQDETPWQGVMRLPKAHCLLVDATAIERREYWQLPTEVTIRHDSDAEYAEHYRGILADCVRTAARSHTPIACDVSGGLDSSAIFCLADRLEKTGELPAPGLHAFTLSAPDGTPADETRYVRAVERQTSREITPVGLFMPDLAWFDAQGEADARLPFLPNTVMLRDMAVAAAERGCRVNLVGQGGDQWLDGLPHYYRQALQMRDWSALRASWTADWRGAGAAWTMREFARQAAMSVVPTSVHEWLKKLRHRNAATESFDARSLLSEELRQALDERRRVFEARFAHLPPDDRIKRMKLESPFALLVNDMMNLQAARAGIEYRHPMLSKAFMTFSAATPEHIRRRGHTTKFVHRQAMASILPDEITHRRDKAYFDQTFDKYLPQIDEHLTQVIDSHHILELIDAGTVHGMAGNYSAPPFDHAPVWTLWGIYASATFLD